MKDIDEKILMAEEIKQLQNKRKKLISKQKEEERKKEIDGFMKKEQFLKVSLTRVGILPKMNFISSLHFRILKKRSIKKSEKS